MFLKFYGKGVGAFVLEMNYDAGFALPEMRADTEAPQPKRAWLYEQSPEEWEVLKKGAEAFLRETIELSIGGTGIPIGWKAEFPDFEKSPPIFPKLADGGAYFRIRIRPYEEIFEPPVWVDLKVLEKPRSPSFVVMLMDGTERLIITEPGSQSRLWESEPPTEEEPQSRLSFGWILLLAGLIGFAIYRKMMR